MYTLSLPVTLHEERSFQIDDRAKIPPIAGDLTLSCEKHMQGYPLILTVGGLPDMESAKTFATDLADAIRCASLDLGYSLSPAGSEPSLTTLRFYDGGHPTVFPTDARAKPMQTTAHLCVIEHLVTLAKPISHGLASGRPKRLREDAHLAVAVRLFSEVEFSGGLTAQFVVLLSALEVLIPPTGGTKRSRVVGLVKKTFQAGGRSDAKETGKRLDALYEARNGLVHEATPVTVEQVARLRGIVRDTLLILVDTPSP